MRYPANMGGPEDGFEGVLNDIKKITAEIDKEVKSLDHPVAKETLTNVLNPIKIETDKFSKVIVEKSQLEEVGDDDIQDVEYGFDGLKDVLIKSVEYAKEVTVGQMKEMQPGCRKIFAKLMKKLFGLLTNLWQKICGFFSTVWEGIKEVWSKIREFFENLANLISSWLGFCDDKDKDKEKKAV